MTKLEALRIKHQYERTMLNLRQVLDIANLSEKEGLEMVSPEVQDLITQFDEATNAIGARIERLVQKLNNAGVLSEDDKAAFTAEVDKLKALGQDPENVVPNTTFAAGPTTKKGGSQTGEPIG